MSKNCAVCGKSIESGLVVGGECLAELEEYRKAKKEYRLLILSDKELKRKMKKFLVNSQFRSDLEELKEYRMAEQEGLLIWVFPCYSCNSMGSEVPRCSGYCQCTKWLNWAEKNGYKAGADFKEEA